RFFSRTAHNLDGELEYFLPRHIHEVQFLVQNLLADWVTRPAAGSLQQLSPGAICSQLEGAEAASFRYRPKNDCASTVAEQNAGVAVCIIGNPGQAFCPNHERMLVH